MKICHQFTPDVEVYSIDEAFLDVTTTHHLFGGPEAIAASIRERVKNQLGITCTVGIAPNILLAKLASDMAKPDGIKWMNPEEVASLLDGIPVKDLWGIGSKLTVRLGALGIRSCGELGRTSASLLRYEFGIIGEHLKNMGMGICNRPLHIREEDPKSIGHSMTFPENCSCWRRGKPRSPCRASCWTCCAPAMYWARWPTETAVCSQCHEREGNPGFKSLHDKHVKDKKYDCSRCHSFTRPERGLR